MNLLTVLLVLAAAVTAREYTDEELSCFPELFHLDDYDRCLARKDGLYCLGTFDLSPDIQPNPTYDLLKEYSTDSYRHFNRTRIHRGYCVSSRCPNDRVSNASDRFERCADKLSRPQALRASLNTFHYCHTHADKHDKPQQTYEQQLFLQCIYAIIVLNVVGTIYDIYKGNSSDKNTLITAFSLPANWQRLTANYEGGDPRLFALTPLNGLRVIAMGFTTFTHSLWLSYVTYTSNPDELEKGIEHIKYIWLVASSSLMQALAMLSCFLTAYNLLIVAQKHPLNLKMLPLCIIKRFIRLAPLNILVTGFAATWWIHLRDGPLVPYKIGVESKICQTKFWPNVLFVNNIIEPSKLCVGPSWFLSMDMHIYIVACAMTLILWRHRSTAIKFYAILVVASSFLIGIVAYIKEYESMVHFATPEILHNEFRNSPSFIEFYQSSWGSLAACFLGLLIAHVQYELDERGIKLSKYKWFVHFHNSSSFPLLLMWPLTGLIARNYRSAFYYGIYAAFDRTIYCIFGSLFMLGLVHVDGPQRRFFGWRGWTVMGRVSLAVLLLHWCVNVTIAIRPVVFGTSTLDVTVDWIATNVITYLLAVPITLLVETPMQKFLGSLIFMSIKY